MCKESEYPNQCGSFFQTAPAKIPTIQCNGPCVTFKNVYDGGCNTFNLTFFSFDKRILHYFLY